MEHYKHSVDSRRKVRPVQGFRKRSPSNKDDHEVKPLIPTLLGCVIEGRPRRAIQVLILMLAVVTQVVVAKSGEYHFSHKQGLFPSPFLH